MMQIFVIIFLSLIISKNGMFLNWLRKLQNKLLIWISIWIHLPKIPKSMPKDSFNMLSKNIL